MFEKTNKEGLPKDMFSGFETSEVEKLFGILLSLNKRCRKRFVCSSKTFLSGCLAHEMVVPVCGSSKQTFCGVARVCFPDQKQMFCHWKRLFMPESKLLPASLIQIDSLESNLSNSLERLPAFLFVICQPKLLTHLFSTAVVLYLTGS